MKKMFSIHFQGAEYSVVFMDLNIGFAGKINDVTIVVGDYEMVRKIVVNTFEFNRDQKESFN